MPLEVMSDIKTREEYLNVIGSNPGLIFVKFGAVWCNPCKVIESDVVERFNNMPDNVQCYMIDIDTNLDVYAFLKTKKMVSGIPAILCYQHENDSYIPDEIHMGSDKTKLNAFFQRCMKLL
jgi:thiol:disulfide interchange protein